MKLWRRQDEDIRVRQAAVNFTRRDPARTELHESFIARVIKCHSDRMTCDIEAPDGAIFHNTAILTKAGLVNGAPYGEIDLPVAGDYVLVTYGGRGRRQTVVIGTIVPYLNPSFMGAPVNSSGKSYTTEFLEADREGAYKRVFHSGATVEVAEDGTIVVETPNGMHILMDVTANKVVINGNLEVLA